MNKKTHQIFGKIIYQYLMREYSVNLNYYAFVLGNISPDLTFSFVVTPHERDSASRQVQRRIHRLTEDEQPEGILFSQAMGSLCHYIADFFCEAHTARYTGGLKAHIRYEQELYFYCRFHEREIMDKVESRPVRLIMPAEIYALIEKANDRYLDGEATFEAQAFGAVQTCIDVLSAVIAHRQAHAFATELAYV